MARPPFFGRGPAPQIARMDMHAATAPGRNWGAAFESIGQTVGDTLEKFRANKEKKKKEKAIGDMVFNQFKDNPESVGADNEDELRVISDSIGKHPETLNVMKFAQTAQAAQQEREAPANFIDRYTGPIGTPEQIAASDANIAAKSPKYGESGIPARFDPTQQAEYQAALAEQAKLAAPLSGANKDQFLKSFKGSDPAVARLALGEFVRRDTPKSGGTIRNLMIDGKEKAVLIDGAGNPVKIVGDVSGQQARVLTPEEEAKVEEERIELGQAGDFLKQERSDAIANAKVIIPASRSLRLLEKGGIKSGGLAEFKTDMVVVMNSLGIPLPNDMVEEAADAEEFRAQVGKFLFLNIQQTKGSISEKEMDIFKKISPNLDMSVAANKSLLKYIIARAEREKKKITFMQGLRKRGVPMRDRQDLVENWMLDNDLSEMIAPIPSGRGGSANAGQIQIPDGAGGSVSATPADSRSEAEIRASGFRIYRRPDGKVVQVTLSGGN
jgi:hypothetical protein